MMSLNLFSFFVFLLVSPLSFGYSIATPAEESTQVAKKILENGGNAIDAAISAALTLNVVQPYNTGIGGGGFFLAKTKNGFFFFNFREMAPLATKENQFLDSNGTPLKYEPNRITGPNPVGVPGFLDGVWTVHQKLGKLSWQTLFLEPIRLARDGIKPSAFFNLAKDEEWYRLESNQDAVEYFSLKNDLLKQEALAETFTILSKEGSKTFYSGTLARQWLSEATQKQVRISAEDLKKYKTIQAQPVHAQVWGMQLYTAPLPSASGIIVAGTLRYLEHYEKTHPKDNLTPLHPVRIVVLAEALREFQKLRNENISDPATAKINPQKFYNSKEEKELWKKIDVQVQQRRDRFETAYAQNLTVPENKTLNETEKGSTAHISIQDDEDNYVSFTSTIEAHFGSGIYLKKSGFFLNNELADFDALPQRPNSPAPFKRPRSNMSPTLLFTKDKNGKLIPLANLGCAGGGKIGVVITEVLENYYRFHLSAEESFKMPRMFPDGDTINLDVGFPEKTISALKTAGYNVLIETVDGMGVAQGILRRSPTSKWEAIGEPRTHGSAFTK